jgi:hypothetical protein
MSTNEENGIAHLQKESIIQQGPGNSSIGTMARINDR